MVGADEFTACDIHWNTVFCGSEAGLVNFLERCEQYGFVLKNAQVQATKREIEIAFATNSMSGV